MKRFLYVLGFLLLLTGFSAQAYAATDKSPAEIKKAGRFQFTVNDEAGREYQAVIYPLREKVVKNKNRKICKGRYQMALLNEHGTAKLHEVSLSLTAIPKEGKLSGAGTAAMLPESAETPSIFGSGLHFEGSDYLTDLFYVKNGKLQRISIFDGENEQLPVIINSDTDVLGSAFSFKFDDDRSDSYFTAKAVFDRLNSRMNYVEVKEHFSDGTVKDHPVYGADKEIQFADENLEAAVREAIDKHSGPIMVSDVKDLKELYAGYSGISDLAGLEYFKSLESVDLSANVLTDEKLAPLADLKNLKKVELYLNNIEKFDIMIDLHSIEYVGLAGNPIETLTYEDDSRTLKGLDLGGTKVTDLGMLRSFPNLEELYLGGNAIADLTPLSNLKSLRTLDLQKVSIESFEPLRSLENLESLNIRDSFYGTDDRIDGSPLSNLTNLKELTASRVHFEDYEFLRSMRKLEALDLSIGKFDDTHLLSSLSQLEELNLSMNGIRNVEGLRSLRNLIYLDLSSNYISDFSPVENLPQLETLVTDFN
ncbi:leucine-rich repeat domain-containing protein [Cytobacillus sp. SAFR-174]|uniref:leucine-rich repeat domain-containing protein n=1 Tax=Cytobacillus sp. SAFR-174 TaxID=3436868 RepID=UPI003F8230D6